MNTNYDFSDIRGHNDLIRRIVESFAAGATVAMRGPCGSGRTMIARRLASLLPPTSWGPAPFRAPHHTISGVALASESDRAGFVARSELNIARGGVLLLDELPEFRRAALEQLAYAHSRIEDHAPRLVFAFNSCACGRTGTERGCVCGPRTAELYSGRVAAALKLFEFVEVFDVPVIPYARLEASPPGPTSAELRAEFF